MEFIGTVIRTKMEKTAIVQVSRLVAHPLYKKRVRKTAKFKAHDPLGVKVGDMVKIESCRPISKEKHFRIKEIITRNNLSK